MKRPSQYESLNPRVNLFVWFLDLITAVVFAPFRLWRLLFGLPKGPIRKILLTRCDGIGDLVLSLSAIRAMRKRFPQAEIALMVGPWAKEIAELITEVDRVIVHAPWGYRRLRTVRSDESVWSDIAFASRMRRERFDLAIDLRGDLLTLLPMAFWKIPRRVGRDTRGGCPTLSQVVAPGPNHEIDRTLAVAQAVGAEINEKLTLFELPEILVAQAKELLKNNSLSADKTIILSPVAQWKWKYWPAERFAALAARLIEEGFQVGVVGAPGDAALTGEIIAACPAKIVDFTGKASLSLLTAVFAQCRGFVAVDSGPAHLAAASGAPGVVLMGSTDPERFAPVGEKVRIVYRACPYTPCYQRGDCPIPDQWCMATISIEDVYAALRQAIG